ncbi:MAG: hypothetical protein DDT25_00012 [Chloroflexi bacterium]|nr:hypothetical protein [Chloroflexota bacterium]
MNVVAVGTRVVGVWGAMIADYYGTVVGHTDAGVPLVEWDEWCESPGLHQYRIVDRPSVNGSPIGVWTRESYHAFTLRREHGVAA